MVRKIGEENCGMSFYSRILKATDRAEVYQNGRFAEDIGSAVQVFSLGGRGGEYVRFLVPSSVALALGWIDGYKPGVTDVQITISHYPTRLPSAIMITAALWGILQYAESYLALSAENFASWKRGWWAMFDDNDLIMMLIILVTRDLRFAQKFDGINDLNADQSERDYLRKLLIFEIIKYLAFVFKLSAMQILCTFYYNLDWSAFTYGNSIISDKFLARGELQQIPIAYLFPNF